MKKVIFLILTTIFTIQLAYGEPVNPAPFEYTQPDGTKITLQAHGDEYGSWLETEDNTIVVMNDNGYVEYATIIDGVVAGSGIRYGSRARRAPSRNSSSTRTANMGIPDRDSLLSQFAIQREILMEALDSMKQAEFENEEPIVARKVAGPARAAAADVKPLAKIDDQIVLCILIQFSDVKFKIAKQFYDDMWNLEDYKYTAAGSYGSVNDFYKENSYGKVNVKADVYGPYEAKYNYAHYQKKNKSAQYNSAEALVKEAINAAIAHGVKLSKYDKNGDGKVDCVHVIYAGYKYNDTYPKAGLFSNHHSYVTVKQNGYATYDYIITPERAGYSGEMIAPMGAVCHEYGHVLGAPDFYDTNYDTGGQYLGTGEYDVMGSGSHNGSPAGSCPAHHNPFTKMYIYQWVPTPVLDLVHGETSSYISPTYVNKTYVLKPSHLNKDFCVFPTGDDEDFFMLENRTKQGFNASIPNPGGLLIYHAHKGLVSAIKDNKVNATHPQKFYIVSGNAPTQQPNSTPSSYGAAPSIMSGWEYSNCFFTPESTPSATSWKGNSMGINLCFIKNVSEGIQFVVNPRIEGPTSLADEAKFEVKNVPSAPRVEWNLINLSSIDINTTITDRPNERSITLKRNVSSNGPKQSKAINQNAIDQVKDLVNQAKDLASDLIQGKIVVLQAIVSVPKGNTGERFNYQMFKDIRLDNTMNNAPAKSAAHFDEEAEIETQKLQEENTSYRLVYANPVINSAEIRVEKLENGVYVPYEGEYTLSLWGDRAGITHHRAEGLPICTFDCTNIPMGVYQLVLQINGKVAASSKMLKLL